MERACYAQRDTSSLQDARAMRIERDARHDRVAKSCAHCDHSNCMPHHGKANNI